MNKVEAEFSNLVKAFRKRRMGKGPREVKDLFVDIDIEKDLGMSIFIFDQNIEHKFSN